MNTVNIPHISPFIVVSFLMALVLNSCSSPKSAFTTDITTYRAPAKVHFQNLSKNAESYTWDFGNGVQTYDINPSHLFLHSGRYTINLEARLGNKSNNSSNDIIVYPPEDCLVLMQTSMGDMVIKLHEETPLHRDNFLKLVKEGFYEGLLFHRVIDGFMIQAGDPNSRNADTDAIIGLGGPGYTIPSEFRPNLHHIRGALAAARTDESSNPNLESSGSQFYFVDGRPVDQDALSIYEAQLGIKYNNETNKIYINQGGTPQLDQKYTVFGQVIIGLDVINRISTVQTNEKDRPIEDVKIIRVIELN